MWTIVRPTPTLDRNSIGLNAVCCGLFIGKHFQSKSARRRDARHPKKGAPYQAIKTCFSLREKNCDVCRNRGIIWTGGAIRQPRVCFYEESWPALQSVSGRRSQPLSESQAGSCGEKIDILWDFARIAGGRQRRSETRFRIVSSIMRFLRRRGCTH
jgi:hypothetical protein